MYNIFEDNDDERFQIAGLLQYLCMPSNTLRFFLFMAVYQFATMPELYFVLFMRDIY